MLRFFPGGQGGFPVISPPPVSGFPTCPVALPPGSLLILDDSTPMDGHDPEQIAGSWKAAQSVWTAPGFCWIFSGPVWRMSKCWFPG